MHTTVSMEYGGRTLTVNVATADVATHSTLSRKEGRWEFFVNAVQDALTRIAEDAKRDPREG